MVPRLPTQVRVDAHPSANGCIREKKHKPMAKERKAANSGKHPLDASRRDAVAAQFRIHTATPRAHIVEYLAKHAGKLFTPEAIGKVAGDWQRRQVQQFLTKQMRAKAAKYHLPYRVVSEAGKYGFAK
jgi:hypothetical protein